MNWYAMSRRALQILVVVLSLALLAACFRIYTLSQDKAAVTQQSTTTTATTTTKVQSNNRSTTAPDSVNNGATTQQKSGKNDYAAGIGTIEYVALPKEAQTVISLIQKRSSFPYRQDGQTFSNRERVLPSQPRGYYQEYTVPTPGADNRGARRIVSGQGTTGDNATSGEYYYTSDHYRSFARVRME